MVALCKKLTRFVPALLLTLLVSTAVGVSTTQPAQAACGANYVANNQWSTSQVVVTVEGVGHTLNPGQSYWWDHYVPTVRVRTTWDAWVSYYDGNRFIRTDPVGAGTFTMSGCHSAWVRTPIPR